MPPFMPEFGRDLTISIYQKILISNNVFSRRETIYYFLFCHLTPISGDFLAAASSKVMNRVQPWQPH